MCQIALSLLVGYCVIAASSPPITDKELRPIARFFKAVHRPSASIADFRSIFGPDSEAETAAILAVYFPSEYANDTASTNPAVVRFVNQRLSRPDAPSEFIRCIRAAAPQLHKIGKHWTVVRRDARGSVDAAPYSVVVGTQIGEIRFVLSSDDESAEDIVLPGNRSVNSLVDRCGDLVRPR